jgi:signal transduction histidine kinase
MNTWKWNPIRILVRVPIFYKVVIANSAMALLVIFTLIMFHEAKVAVAVVAVACGIINALLVQAALSVESLRVQQRELFAWSLNEAEKERGRVADQLHEGAAQRLAAIALQTSADQAVSSEAVQVMQDLCDTAHTLRPPRMQLLGLEGALGWYTRNVELRLGTPVTLTTRGALDNGNPALAMGLYRIIEDAVETVAHHAPGQVDVDVASMNTFVTISVRGHFGASTSAGRLSRAESFRLSERGACLGGTVEIIDTPAETVIRVRVLKQASHVGNHSRLAG